MQRGKAVTQNPLQTDRKPRELVSFRLGTQEFCVDIMAVREIRGWTQATPLPHAPAYVLGMINLRGTVLPVIDVGTLLGLPADRESTRRVVIVVWIGNRLGGLLVDAVCDILTVSDEAVMAPPEISDEKVQSFVSGVITVDDRMICLLTIGDILPALDSEAA